MKAKNKKCNTGLIKFVLFYFTIPPTFLKYKSQPVWADFVCLLRSRADSNRCRSFCRALPSRSATGPYFLESENKQNILNPFRYLEKIKDKWFSITYSNQIFLRKTGKNKYNWQFEKVFNSNYKKPICVA